MVNNRLQWYLEKHKLYNPNQSGFRKNRNTMEQCIRLENLVMFYCLKKHLHMIAYYHIYLEIPFFAVNHVSITYQMLFKVYKHSNCNIFINKGFLYIIF
jgi:hypothetical protein